MQSLVGEDDDWTTFPIEKAPTCDDGSDTNTTTHNCRKVAMHNRIMLVYDSNRQVQRSQKQVVSGCVDDSFHAQYDNVGRRRRRRRRFECQGRGIFLLRYVFNYPDLHHFSYRMQQ
jgi:hypothetical protein